MPRRKVEVLGCPATVRMSAGVLVPGKSELRVDNI